MVWAELGEAASQGVPAGRNPTSLSSHPLSPVGAPHWTNPTRSRRGREFSDVVVGANFLDTKKGEGGSMEEIQQNITVTVAQHTMFRTVAHGKDVPQGLDINYWLCFHPSCSPPSHLLSLRKPTELDFSWLLESSRLFPVSEPMVMSFHHFGMPFSSSIPLHFYLPQRHNSNVSSWVTSSHK